MEGLKELAEAIEKHRLTMESNARAALMIQIQNIKLSQYSLTQLNLLDEKNELAGIIEEENKMIIELENQLAQL